MLAWHWLKDDCHLRHPPYTKVEVGQTLTAKPPLDMCIHGMHASKRVLDALRYAPGAMVCRVRLGGEIIEDDDKVVATERTVLWMFDATRVLHEFACWCAEEVLLRERAFGREPHPHSWAAIKIKRLWLAGKATDDDLIAAEGAARCAAESVAERAARNAAERAAWSAAWSAARNAAERAAWRAAWSAAGNAAWNAAGRVQNTKLEEMICAAAGRILDGAEAEN